MTSTTVQYQKAGVTAVIPAYNEAECIGSVLTTLKGVDPVDEVIVIDDGSQDETAEIVRQHAQNDPRICLISLPQNQGKGNALLAGADASQNDVLLFMDAALKEVDSGHIMELIRPVREGQFEMSIGLFEDGRWKTNITHELFPFLSGQRCLRWSLFKDLYRKFINGWSIETALSLHARIKEYPVAYIIWPGVTHAIRTEKRGFLAGIWSHLKMWQEISKYFLNFIQHHLLSEYPIKLKQLKWNLKDKNASYFNF